MAAWQVDLYLVPRSAVAATATTLTAAALGETDWWAAAVLPSDYQRRLDGVAPRAPSSNAQLATWGQADGNRVDVSSASGRVRSVVARIDVRRLDSRFGAALIGFVRASGAVLVRADGLVVEPTIAAYAAALRTSTAWKFANDPAASFSSYAKDDDDED